MVGECSSMSAILYATQYPSTSTVHSVPNVTACLPGIHTFKHEAGQDEPLPDFNPDFFNNLSDVG